VILGIEFQHDFEGDRNIQTKAVIVNVDAVSINAIEMLQKKNLDV
jgi:hypothetical protein